MAMPTVAVVPDTVVTMATSAVAERVGDIASGMA